MPPPSSRWSRCCRWCRCSACCSSATKDLRGRSSRRGCRRAGAAQFLLLDRGAHGRPPRAVQPARVAVVAGLGYIYATLEPRYRLADQVPDKRQAVAASSRLDAKLTGANPIDVLIEFPKGASLYAPDTLKTIAEVHSMVEKSAASATSGRSRPCAAGLPERPAAATSRP